MRRSPRRTSEGLNDPDRSRPYRAKGPTLGKGKACELCRARRVRCDGARPSCANCIVAARECVYVDYSRPSASTGALSAKLESLQRRYQELMQASASSSSGESTMMDEGIIAGQAQLLDQKLDDPWLEVTLGRDVRNTLLRIYMSECYRYAVAFVPKDQTAAFGLEDPSERPHPCLLHAMVLAAMDLGATTRVNISSREDISNNAKDTLPVDLPSPERLLTLVQSYCAQALANADRLQDYLQAELIVAFWYLRHGRVLEAQFGLAAVSRLTISCKLNKIDKEVIQEVTTNGLNQDQSWWDGSLLGRPKSEDELALRISLFWQSYYGDKTVSLQTGVLSTYEDVEETYVTTVWPNIGRGDDPNLIQLVDGASYSEIFDGLSLPSAGPFTYHLTVLLKAVILLDRAIRLGSLATSELDGVLKLELGIRRFESEILRGPLFEDSLATLVQPNDKICFKALVQLLVIGSKIQFTHIDTAHPKPSQDDESISEQRLRYAHESVQVISSMMKELETLEGPRLADEGRAISDYMGVTTGILIMTSQNIVATYVNHLEDRLIGEPDGSPSLTALQNQIDGEREGMTTLLDAISQIRSSFPFFESQWNTLKSVRASTYH